MLSVYPVPAISHSIMKNVLGYTQLSVDTEVSPLKISDGIPDAPLGQNQTLMKRSVRSTANLDFLNTR
jgi:hypothetical protein